MKGKYVLVFLFIVLFTIRVIAQCPLYVSSQDGWGQIPGPLIAVSFDYFPPAGHQISFEYQGQVAMEAPLANANYTFFYQDNINFAGTATEEDLTMILHWDDDRICMVEPPEPIVYKCPTWAIYSEDVNEPGLGGFWNCPTEGSIIQVLFEVDDPIPNMNNVQFYFENDPLADGIYSRCGRVQSTFGFDIDCNGPPSTLVISTNSGDLVCPYNDNGIWCENCDPYLGLSCIDLFENCGSGIIDFVQKELKKTTFCKQWEGDCGLSNSIWRTGQVAVGTDLFHTDFNLSVNGGIMTDHFRLCDEDNPIYWCDYVFEKDYDLWSLPRVEQFIKAHQHLHKTRPGAEIEAEGGFELKAITLDHQEKIEEIFLHLIDLDKQLEKLEMELKKD